MKNQPLRTSILLTLLLGLFFFARPSSAQSTDDWTLQSEKNGVKLYFRTASCGEKNMLFLKLENTNSAAKHVNYHVIVESEGHNMPLLPQTIELPAAETKSGSCDGERGLATDIRNISNPRLVVVLAVN
jgi:hypothetical protein